MGIDDRLRGVGDFFFDFLGWWLSELAGLRPVLLRGRSGPAKHVVHLAFTNAGVGLRRGEEERLVEGSRPSVGEALAAFAGRADPSRLSVRLAVPNDQVFSRSADYPAAARDKVRGLTLIDIKRSMPFSDKDVYFWAGVETEDKAKGIVRTRQIFVKKPVLDALLARAENLGVIPASAAPMDAPPLANLLPPAFRRRHLATGLRLFAARAASIAACGLIFLSAIDQRQDKIVAELRAKLVVAKREAESAKADQAAAEAALAHLNALRTLKRDSASATLVWDELSKALPDSAFATDFKIARGAVVVNGFADDAARLVNLLETRPTIENVNFSAPVTVDKREEKERFSLSFNVTAPASERRAKAPP